MAHELDLSNNRANMAYIGQAPWHGLGERLDPGADIATWRKAAGLDWSVDDAPILYMDPDGVLTQAPGRILVRDDTGAPLGMVSERYNVLQPGEVLEFYRDMTDSLGYQLETAGSLRGGKRVWALARTGQEARIKGQDLIEDYVLLATSFDGTMATVASRTGVRVVCMNTFRLAVGESGNGADVKIPHHSTFVASEVKARLGIGEEDTFTSYIEKASELASRKVKPAEAAEFMLKVYYGVDDEGNVNADIESKAVGKRVASLMKVYDGAVGQDLASAKGTAWGLVNAVTRFEDHERTTRSQDNRLNTAWFGDGQRRKQAAWDEAWTLVA